ncbi:MAG: fibronectin type III domain-containing protein [Verrucomicrobiota bacterium]
MKTKSKILSCLMFAVIGLGLMLCSNARATIALLDGAGPGGIYSTNGTHSVSTITNCFTVSQGASVMVCELWDQNGNSQTASPSFMTWSNATLGTTQILTRAVVTNANAGGYIDTGLYYLWNPLPGTGVVSATDTNSTAPNHMFIQTFDLSGVDTTANGTVPFSAASANSSATTLSVTTPNNLSGAWAAVMNQNYNGGSGNTTTNTASSGTAVGFNWFPAGQLQMCSGYISNMTAGVSTITATASGGASHMDVVAMVFEPAIGTGIYVHDGSIFNYNAFSNSLFTITNNLTITPGAGALVVELYDFPTGNSTNASQVASGNLNPSPQFLIWSNATLGTTQIVNLAISTASGYGISFANLYYLWDPSPGTGVVMGTDSASTAPAGMCMDSYTLAGVDTTANGTVPFTASSAPVPPWPPNLPTDNTVLTVTTSPSTVANSWAASISDQYNGGGGNIITNTCTSGGGMYYNFQPGVAGVLQMCMGLTTNLASGVSTITCTASGSPSHIGLGAAVFSPIQGVTAPINVTATGQQNKIAVKWTDTSGGTATSWQILRSTSPVGGFALIATNPGNTATNYTDSSVVNWTVYYYEIIAVGAGGSSSPSAPPASGAAIGVPGNVSTLLATNGINSVALTWTNLGATNFYILRSTTSGGEVQVHNITAGTAGVPGFSYTDTGLTEGTLYYYEVQPYNYYGNGPVSAEASAIPCVAIFTNWISIDTGPSCTNGWISEGNGHAVWSPGSIYPSPPPSTGYLDLQAFMGPTNQNTIEGIQTNLPAFNLAPYTEMNFDYTPILGFDQYGQVQAIQLYYTINGTADKLENLSGPNAGYQGDIIIFDSIDTIGNNIHFTLPLGGGFLNPVSPPETCTALLIQVADFNEGGTTSNEMDEGFANIELDGAPGYTPAYANLNNPTIAPGTASVTLSGTVTANIGGTPMYLFQGTPVMVTVQGLTTQTTTISDATGDFSINYTGTGGLVAGPYNVYFTNSSDNATFVAGSGTGTLTVGTPVISSPKIPAPVLNAAHNALLVTPGGNTASGHTYYLLQTTNLSPPVVWTTNTSFAGTGAPVTNTVPLNSAKDIFLKYLIN